MLFFVWLPRIAVWIGSKSCWVLITGNHTNHQNPNSACETIPATSKTTPTHRLDRKRPALCFDGVGIVDKEDTIGTFLSSAKSNYFKIRFAWDDGLLTRLRDQLLPNSALGCGTQSTKRFKNYLARVILFLMIHSLNFCPFAFAPSHKNHVTTMLLRRFRIYR